MHGGGGGGGPGRQVAQNMHSGQVRTCRLPFKTKRSETHSRSRCLFHSNAKN